MSIGGMATPCAAARASTSGMFGDCMKPNVRDDAEEPVAQPLERESALRRAPRGCRASCTLSSTTVSCSTLLCLRWCSSTTGTPSGARRHEHRRALHAHRRVALDAAEEEVERQRARVLDRAELHAPALPGAHQRVDADRHDERHPAAVLDLDDVGDEEREVDERGSRRRAARRAAATSPSASARRRRTGAT